MLASAFLWFPNTLSKVQCPLSFHGSTYFYGFSKGQVCFQYVAGIRTNSQKTHGIPSIWGLAASERRGPELCSVSRVFQPNLEALRKVTHFERFKTENKRISWPKVQVPTSLGRLPQSQKWGAIKGDRHPSPSLSAIHLGEL